jgi:hypothetical protein
MGKHMIESFGWGEHLVRREQEQSVEDAREGDILRRANSNMYVVPPLFISPFLSNRCEIWTDVYSYYFSLRSDGLNEERKLAPVPQPISRTRLPGSKPSRLTATSRRGCVKQARKFG